MLNNPLGYTDPSGSFFKKIFKRIKQNHRHLRGWVKRKWTQIRRAAITAAAFAVCGLECAVAAYSARRVRDHGGDTRDAFNAGFRAGFTAYVSANISVGISEAFPVFTQGAAINSANILPNLLGHALIGGAAAGVNGGDFSKGALLGIGLAGLKLAFQGVKMSSRQLGSGSQAEGASSASDAELAKALDALRTDKDFAAMEAEASKLWGKNIEYKWTSGETFAHNGVVHISKNWSSYAYNARLEYPASIEALEGDAYWKALDAYDAKMDVSSAQGIQRPFSLRRIIYHETAHLAHGPKMQLFHSEMSVIEQTNKFMSRFGEARRINHELLLIDR